MSGGNVIVILNEGHQQELRHRAAMTFAAHIASDNIPHCPRCRNGHYLTSGQACRCGRKR